MNGIFDFTISEKPRGFKFGTYALKVATDLEKCSLSDFMLKFSSDEGLRNINIGTLINVFYGAAVHYAKSKKQEIDFNDADVSDWIDELGYDEATRMLTEGFQQYSPKNSKSLEETREKLAVTA
jgi:hypothetical protein